MGRGCLLYKMTSSFLKAIFDFNEIPILSASWNSFLYPPFTQKMFWKETVHNWDTITRTEVLNHAEFLKKRLIDYFFLILLESVTCTLRKKWSFTLQISSVNVTKSADADLVIFTEEILNWKLHFLDSGRFCE